jgi:hypothetical protein
MTYDLRRLRLHGLIQRVSRTHRYRPTTLGWRTAWFYTHAYNRFFRTDVTHLTEAASTAGLRRAPDALAAQSALDPYPRLGTKLDSKTRLRRAGVSAQQRCHGASFVRGPMASQPSGASLVRRRTRTF